MKTQLLGVSLLLVILTAPMGSQSNSQKIIGFIVATNCARAHGKEVGYARNHDKRCNLIEPCKKSGYSLVTSDRNVYIFDQKGSELALALLTETDKDKEEWLAGLRRDWRVEVTGALEGETLAVSSIRPILK